MDTHTMDVSIYKAVDGSVMVEVHFDEGRFYLSLEENPTESSWGIVSRNEDRWQGMGQFGFEDLERLKKFLEEVIDDE